MPETIIFSLLVYSLSIVRNILSNKELKVSLGKQKICLGRQEPLFLKELRIPKSKGVLGFSDTFQKKISTLVLEIVEYFLYSLI